MPGVLMSIHYRYIDAKAIRDQYYQDGWATEFNLKLKLVMMEYQVRRCLVTPPEAEIGLFAMEWDELSEEQQTAAKALGYSNDGRIKYAPVESPLLHVSLAFIFFLCCAALQVASASAQQLGHLGRLHARR